MKNVEKFKKNTAYFVKNPKIPGEEWKKITQSFCMGKMIIGILPFT